MEAWLAVFCWMPHVASCHKFSNIFQSFCFFCFSFILKATYNINLNYSTNSHGLKHLTFFWFIQNISCLRLLTGRSWKLLRDDWLKNHRTSAIKQWKHCLDSVCFYLYNTCQSPRNSCLSSRQNTALKTPLVTLSWVSSLHFPFFAYFFSSKMALACKPRTKFGSCSYIKRWKIGRNLLYLGTQ